MISIRKLAAVDMAWLGTRLVLAEYAGGFIVPLVLGLVLLRPYLFGQAVFGWGSLLGLWLVGIAANYVPMLLYAIVLARGSRVASEGQPELANARRYGIQQIVLLVPVLVVVLAGVQELRQRQH